ncbi:MAG: nickel-dependent lactate racemase [Thermodesulfobacteriota bacterium]
MFRVPFGRSYIDFDPPAGMRGVLVTSRTATPLPDLAGAVASALAAPVNSHPLRDLARPGLKVCLVFTDATRSSPDQVLVPALLAELERAGVRDRDITLLCGLGLHRPATVEELETKLGASVLKRFRVESHRPLDPSDLVDLGVTTQGVPLIVNRLAAEADLLLATGLVEPHQYAGYSGGRKTVAIGAGGEAMIARTHGPEMVDHPGTRLGRLEGNPFHEAISAAARRAGLKFILNVVQDEMKRPVAVLAGEPEATFGRLVQAARKLYETPIPRQFDLAVAGVGHPKDANIYQACRAASYLFFAPTSVVREGGAIILPAPTPEGAGQGLGEKRFLETMRSAGDMTSLLAKLRRTGYPPGAQRAFIMAKVMEKIEVIVVGSETPEIVRQVHMTPARDMDEAFRLAARRMGRTGLEAAVVPQALLTLPIVTPGESD